MDTAISTQATILDLFAGPGGWDRGAELAGFDPALIHGIELDKHAVQTARAAGYNRTQADVMDLDPQDFDHITGLIASAPCPTFSASGKKSGLTCDYQTVLDVITHMGMEDGCDCSWEEFFGEAADSVLDPRTALVLQAVRFMFELENLEWAILEQVPVLEYMWEDISAELTAAGWQTANVLVLDAADFGAAARRKRVFLIAHKYRPVHVGARLTGQWNTSVAETLGWAPGDKIRTRNNRKPTGGNLFSADGPAWCLTGSARSWTRESTGEQLNIAEASLLQGFPADFPWSGSRTRQFLQVGNVVIPQVAAELLSAVINA